MSLALVHSYFLVVSCRVFPTAADLACGFSIPHPSYGPSDLALFPPPFPISHNDPIITIYSFACTLHPDHYKIPHTEGTIGVRVLVQAKTWVGPLCVLRFIAQNHWDMVVKCDGQDRVREQIVRFIIIAHKLMTCPQDIISGSGCFAMLQQYPEAPDTSFFLVHAKGANLLNTPSSLLLTDYVD
jgi:hypothetical protein